LTNSKKTPRQKPPEKNAPVAAPDGGGLSGDPSSVLAALLENKEKALADRAELTAKTINGDFVLCVTVGSVIGNIFSTYRTQVVCIDETLGDIIAAVFGASENVHEIRKIMSAQAYGMMGELEKQLEAFIEANSADENGEPSPNRQEPRKKTQA